MAKVKLGDTSYQNVAVVRMNTPDGSIVDFYESNYYDIDISAQGDIIAEPQPYTKYNINSSIDKNTFDRILNQRMIPRILVARSNGSISTIFMNRIEQTISSDEETIWEAYGDFGAINQLDYVNFRIKSEIINDESFVFLECFRFYDQKLGYEIDLVDSVEIDFSKYEVTELDLADLIDIDEILLAVNNKNMISLKVKGTYPQSTTLNVALMQIQTKDQEINLSGSIPNPNVMLHNFVYFELHINLEEKSIRLNVNPIFDFKYVQAVNGIYPDNFGELFTYIELDATRADKIDYESKEDDQKDITQHILEAETLIPQIVTGAYNELKIYLSDANGADIEALLKLYQRNQSSIQYVGSIHDPNSSKYINLTLDCSYDSITRTATAVLGRHPFSGENTDIKTLTTADLVIDWTEKKITQTFSDGSIRTATIELDDSGLPTKIGDMMLSIVGVGA